MYVLSFLNLSTFVNGFLSLFFLLLTCDECMSLTCAKCTYLYNVDISQLTDNNTILLVNAAITNVYGATQCEAAEQGNSYSQVTFENCSNPALGKIYKCATFKGSMYFHGNIDDPNANVTGDLVHRECAEVAASVQDVCSTHTSTNWNSLSFYNTFALLQNLISNGYYTGEVCYNQTKVHSGQTDHFNHLFIAATTLSSILILR